MIERQTIVLRIWIYNHIHPMIFNRIHPMSTSMCLKPKLLCRFLAYSYKVDPPLRDADNYARLGTDTVSRTSPIFQQKMSGCAKL